jgi:sugar (pentulose or hexulose) kinase
MVVLEKPLSKVYPEIDMVTTPTGKPVAMVHCNNCTSDFDRWVGVFRELAGLVGSAISTRDLYDLIYNVSLKGDPDCGGVIVYNYLSGEPITGFTEGRPLVLRSAGSHFSIANFTRAQLYSMLATLKIGMDILAEEKVSIRRLMGHGGLFKTPVVGQKYLAAATNSPVSVMKTVGEGGPYGMALLAAYMINKRNGQTLEDYLDSKVFNGAEGSTISPEEADVNGFNAFLKNYKAGLAVEKAACDIK